MTRRRHISTSERAEIFARDAGLCGLCGERIDGTTQAWEVEHRVPLAMGGGEARGSVNLYPVHQRCHRGKTAIDAGKLAKAKRVAAKHSGAFRPRSRPIPGSKASGLKKPFNGNVVRRTP